MALLFWEKGLVLGGHLSTAMRAILRGRMESRVEVQCLNENIDEPAIPPFSDPTNASWPKHIASLSCFIFFKYQAWLHGA